MNSYQSHDVTCAHYVSYNETEIPHSRSCSHFCHHVLALTHEASADIGFVQRGLALPRHILFSNLLYFEWWGVNLRHASTHNTTVCCRLPPPMLMMLTLHFPFKLIEPLMYFLFIAVGQAPMLIHASAQVCVYYNILIVHL